VRVDEERESRPPELGGRDCRDYPRYGAMFVMRPDVVGAIVPSERT
jgi:hypothetical protein